MKYCFGLLAVISLFMTGCNPQPATATTIQIFLIADGHETDLYMPTGANVEQALEESGLSIGALDRVEPEIFTQLNNEDKIYIIRVEEEFTVEQEVIPFERKILQTESLPDQTTLIVQKGENGIKEITYRHVYEDGVKVKTARMNEGVIIKDALDEIIMVGIQASFATYPIPGRLAYLLGGNAWMMEGTTGNRRPIVCTGDLDGRVFALSPDANWLLITRKSIDANQINNLWVVKIGQEPEDDKLIDLKIGNVVHFAEWLPGNGKTEIYFSTAESREAAPGWQANNDLHSMTISSSGWISKWKTLIETNSGGIYGWWGTNFQWDNSGEKLAFARPDGVGIVNLEEGLLEKVLEILPYQTRGDWAWVPWISWSPDGQTIFSIEHIHQNGSSMPEESPLFNLVAIPQFQGGAITLATQTGMFGYPIASPFIYLDSGLTYRVAFLQAIFPQQSDTSKYRLTSLDRDGSNLVTMFPGLGEAGLDPQKFVWSPVPMPDSQNYAMAVIYQGNLWLIDDSYQNQTPIVRQITGDGLVSRLSWVNP
jgi:hypothetical protein